MRFLPLSALSVASLGIAGIGGIGGIGGIAGCGGCSDDNRPRLPDAPPQPDADADIDTAAEAVTLTVTKNGAPVPGVLVYFQNANNSLVKKADTDAAGKASAIMDAGGFVTAIDPFASESPQSGDNDLRTFAGVKPGDALVLTRVDSPFTSVTLTLPTDPLASDYDIGTSCGTGSISTGGGSGALAAPVGVIMLRGCGSALDILVVARDSTTGEPRSALYHPNVTVGPTIDLSADTFQALSDRTFSFSYVPEVGSLFFDHTLASARGSFGIPFPGSVSLSGGSGTTTIKEPVVTGAIGVVDANLFTGSRHHVLDWRAASAAYTLDMSGLLLRNVSDDAAYAVTTNQLTWTEDVDGNTPDLTITALNVSAASERTWRWVIAAPYHQGELTFPLLPVDVADWNPGPSDNVSADRLINAKLAGGGYDAVRARIHDIRDAFEETGRFSGFVGGPTGQAMVVQPETAGVRRGR